MGGPARDRNLHGVDPYTRLVDLLQRVDEHPAVRCNSRRHGC